MKLTYCFTLRATIDQTIVGEIHGGYRVDLAYSPKDDSVTFEGTGTPAYPLAADLAKAEAAITSGNDWAFVSYDAIVDFDSRITLRLDRDGHALIGGRLRGRADLRKVVLPPGSKLSSKDLEEKPLQSWRNGLPAGAHLPLLLTVSFDVPKTALQPDLQATYEKYRDLSRTMFVGIGKDFFTGTKPGAEGDRRHIEIALFTTNAGAEK